MNSISTDTLNKFRQETLTSHTSHLAMNAVTANGISKAAIDIEGVKKNIHEYSVSLKNRRNYFPG